jgi:hypothetical protein
MLLLYAIHICLCKVYFDFISNKFLWNFISEEPFVLSPFRNFCLLTNDSEILTEKLPSHKSLIMTYRSLQLLTNHFNSLTRDYILVSINDFQTVLAVICNFVLIQLHDRVPLEGLFTISMLSFTATMYLLLSYIHLGTINEASKNLIRSWKNTCRNRKSTLMSKYVKSFRSIRIELGSFGYYRKPTSIQIVGKLIFYTSKFIMVTKRYF